MNFQEKFKDYKSTYPVYKYNVLVKEGAKYCHLQKCSQIPLRLFLLQLIIHRHHPVSQEFIKQFRKDILQSQNWKNQTTPKILSTTQLRQFVSSIVQYMLRNYSLQPVEFLQSYHLLSDLFCSHIIQGSNKQFDSINQLAEFLQSKGKNVQKLINGIRCFNIDKFIMMERQGTIQVLCQEKQKQKDKLNKPTKGRVFFGGIIFALSTFLVWKFIKAGKIPKFSIIFPPILTYSIFKY